MTKKQTSSRVSSIAARLLAKLPRYKAAICVADSEGKTFMIPLRDLRALCASALSQDETKGQKAKRAKKAGKR
jgi:hypothetical protein